MADGYWNRQPPLHPASMPAPKRPRAEFDVLPAPLGQQEMINYLPRDDVGGPHIVKDTKSIGASYDRYLQSGQIPSFGAVEASNFGPGIARNAGGGMAGFPGGDNVGKAVPGPLGPDAVPNGRNIGFGGPFPPDPMVKPGREMPPLPPDASNTLYVEGLPPDSTRREVAHIFRPFLGYSEVRLVNKESKHHGGDPLILCFVDFTNAACAATALDSLQGYRMDDQDPDSHYLRLQFARFPGPRSGLRGRR